MKKIVTIIVFCLAVTTGFVMAHHPAEDIVDSDIYAMIDEMVSDTPHADLEFDGMGNTTITADSVSEAEALIDDGLLAVLSLLNDDVTVTISFGVDSEAANADGEDTRESNRWTERDDWGRQVIFTINTCLCCFADDLENCPCRSSCSDE